jgi:hypothetical protein
MSSTKPTSALADAAFIVFALATAGGTTATTIAHPQSLQIATTTLMWLGFGVMALDRFWLQRRGRATPPAPKG